MDYREKPVALLFVAVLSGLRLSCENCSNVIWPLDGSDMDILWLFTFRKQTYELHLGFNLQPLFRRRGAEPVLPLCLLRTSTHFGSFENLIS